MGKDITRAMRAKDLGALVTTWQRGGEPRRRLVAALAKDGALGWAERLLTGSHEARRLAAAVLGESEGNLEGATELLWGLVADPDHRTRDIAAQAMGRLLSRQFAQVYPILGAWRTDPDPLVRRAVPLAAAAGAEPERLDWAAPLLELISPLLSDRAPEVRPVLGPGVLAHRFFSLYPDDTFEYLAHWSTSHDEQVLWHVAMALSGPTAAARFARKSLILLRKLSLDERRYVRGAVTAALKRLGALAPDPVLSELKRWLTDEARAPIARAALGAL